MKIAKLSLENRFILENQYAIMYALQSLVRTDTSCMLRLGTQLAKTETACLCGEIVAPATDGRRRKGT